MSVYPDPSIIVASFTDEPKSDKARTFLVQANQQRLIASWWTFTEVTSAFGVRVRTGATDAAAKPAILHAIRGSLLRSATLIAPLPADFEAASAYMEQTDRSLRGGDALHLAIAAHHDSVLWTFDIRMAEAGQALGLGTRLLA